MPDRHEIRTARWAPTYYAVWASIGGIVLLAAVGWALARIAGVLAPFVLAFLFVFLLQSPVASLERRGVGRSTATLVCFVTGFFIVSLIVVFLFPPIGRELVSFANAIPDYLKLGEDLLLAARERFSDIVVPPWVQSAAGAIASSIGNVFMSLGDTLARGIVSAGSGIATVFFDLFLAIVVAFWTLRDLPKIRTEMRVLAGDKYEDDLENLLGTVGRVVGGYLKGQTIASAVTGTMAAAGLAIVGVPYALVLGIITFIFNYVPYIGPFFAGLIAAVVGLFLGPLQALLAIVAVLAAQQLTDLFVTPRVMSEQVDLHPILVIFSLLAGGSLFGFWGMIFAIPIAATAKGLFVYYWERRTNRALATEDGALFRSPACPDDAPDCDEQSPDDAPRGGRDDEQGSP